MPNEQVGQGEQGTRRVKQVRRVRRVAPQPTKRRRRGFLNFLLIIGIIAAVALFVWSEQQRRSAINQLEETESELAQIRESTQQSADEVAQEVLTKLRRHISLPEEPVPTVATIVDVDRLRESDDFYNQAKNGDHLIITNTRAILYDSSRDLIIDMVPVRFEDNTAADIPPAPETAPDTAPPVEGEPAPDGAAPVPESAP